MALTDDLIGFWSLEDDAANTTVVDDTGNNNGTASTNTSNLSEAAKVGDGFDLDGSAENVSVTETGITADSMSIQAWVQPDDTAANPIVSKRTSGNCYQLAANASNEPYFIVWSGGAAGSVTDTGNAMATDGTFYHLVGTYDGSDVRLYVNGSEVGTGDSFTGNINDTTTAIKFGTDSPGGSNYFNGTIDEIGLWNRGLTSAEVTSLYNGDSGLAYPFAAAGTNMQINIGDTWKEIVGKQINIGDAWKEVAGAQINIGDTWKEIW